MFTFGPIADTGSLRGDLVHVHTARADYLSAMTAARRENADVELALRTRHDHVQAALRPIVERAEMRGELQHGIDPELLLDLVCSVVIQRAMRSDEVPSPTFPEQVVDAVLIGFAS